MKRSPDYLLDKYVTKWLVAAVVISKSFMIILNESISIIWRAWFFFVLIIVSEDLDGVPLYSSSSPSVRSKQVVKATTSKWETDPPVLASSKWDNPDLENDQYESSSKKKNRDYEDIFTDADVKVSDEELDGTPLDDSSQETIHHGSDSKFVVLLHFSS